MEIVLQRGHLLLKTKKAKAYKQARGKGGHVRANWKDVTDIIAAQILYTIKKDGPDRIAGFTPFLPCQ